MSTWRVAQHYGFGAARIPICPEAHRVEPSGLREGFADLRAEFVSGGAPSMARRIVGQSPSIALCFLLIASFVVTLVRDHSDVSPIDVVLFNDALVPEPIEKIPEVRPELLPEPLPLVAEVPEPVPEPVPVVLPKPLPVSEPQRVADITKPKPPPVSKPVLPKPSIRPQIEKIAKARPPSPVLPKRSERSRSLPTSKPRVEIAAARPRLEPMQAPAPVRAERLAVVPPSERSIAPRLDAPAAPRLDRPSDAPPVRGFRAAASPNAPRVRVPRVAPEFASTPTSPVAPAQELPGRARQASLPSKPKSRVPSITPSLSAGPAITARAQPPAPARRDSRPARPATTARAPRPSTPKRKAPANLASAAVPTSTARVALASHPVQDSGANGPRPGLAGVPLADLAACVSDREEDRLKQAVVAAVTTQDKCVSRAGIYQFVETKNLNSFLMRIDGSSGRSVGDRCDELRNALECLQGESQRAAR